MAGDRLRVLHEARVVKPLDGGRHLRVEYLPPFVQEGPVGDLVGERVLERVCPLGEHRRLVEELGCLEVRQPVVQRVLGQLGDRVQERERDILADHGGRLQEALLLGWKPVDASCKHGLDGGGHPDAGQWFRQATVSALAGEDLCLDQRADVLLQEERVAVGALDQDLLEGVESRIVAEQDPEELR